MQDWIRFSIQFLKSRDRSCKSAIQFISSFSILFVAWLYFCFGLFMKIQETGHESVLIVLSLYSFPLILRLELEQTCIIMYKHHNVKEQIWKTKKWNDFSSFSHTWSCLHPRFSLISKEDHHDHIDAGDSRFWWQNIFFGDGFGDKITSICPRISENLHQSPMLSSSTFFVTKTEVGYFRKLSISIIFRFLVNLTWKWWKINSS